MTTQASACPPRAPAGDPRQQPAGLPDPADAPEARITQCDRDVRHGAGRGGRDLLYRPARRRAAGPPYSGRLGVEPLAGIALVFPFVMLTQMMSAGAMGGGVSSAVSRALGAGDRDRAAVLALHAAMIGVCGGIFFTAMLLLFGRQFFSALGGRGEVLEQASSYSNVLFSGAIAIW